MNKTVYFLIDLSGSMHGSRGDAVNTAMEAVVKDVLPLIKDQKSAQMDIRFKAIGFKGERDVRVLADASLEDFSTAWKPLPGNAFDGGTPTGAAIQAVIDDIQGGMHGDVDPDAFPPAIILISDGLPNGKDPTYEEVLEYADRNSPKYVRAFHWAIRVAIGMNVDENGQKSLQKFGSVSSSMERAGIKSYYDCSGEYAGQLVEILKSTTLHASIGS